MRSKGSTSSDEPRGFWRVHLALALKALVFDLFLFGGLGLILLAAWGMHWTLAALLAGVLMIALAIVGARALRPPSPRPAGRRHSLATAGEGRDDEDDDEEDDDEPAPFRAPSVN